MKENVWSVYVSYLKFVFCVSAVTEMMGPALSEFLNSALKLSGSLHSVATLLLVLSSEEKKARPV